ncbi:MAG: nucleoside 2-deoxyribosyltransferase [Lachnospiraceae bacterium]|nr:nucleoside 2-deoxyribosyltransferase [Lachnospiraceae bacterium]
MSECPLCGRNAQIQFNGPLNQNSTVKCDNCGMYRLTDVTEDKLYSFPHKHIISGYTKENWNKKNIVYIKSDDLDSIVNSPIVPKSIEDKLIKLISWMYRKSEYYGQQIEIPSEPAIAYAKNEEELIALIHFAVDYGLVENIGKNLNPFDSSYTLTLKGYKNCELINIKDDTSNSAFIAMWFSSEMKNVYDEAIKPAIENPECGYKAFRVDNYEHNNDITDEIIAGINRSHFVVADMTGYRGGVYYEAGYARGLGKPVIYTCRKDWFDGELAPDGTTIKEKIHFDINHLNVIVWENPEELKEKLISRIKATINH